MVRIPLIALLLMSAALPQAAVQTVRVDTYRGEATVAANPRTTVVFDVPALDTLDALGVQVQGVIANAFVDYIDFASQTAAHVGTPFEPNYEAVAALAPDLVIAGGRSAGAVDDLARIAPTIDMTIWEDTIGQGLARLQALGQIFGKETEAAALEAAFQTKLMQARNAVAGQGGALILMTNGPKVAAYGTGGRFGWLHTALALPEAVADVQSATHGEAISFEFIRDADPEILIVVDRLAAIGQDGANAAATLDNALVRETRAWRDGKVIYVPSAPIYVAGGGIQAMNLILDQIIAAFPEP
ncbi:MAG: siderophore ABC transporter substrate-binding protein [Pseudomonadota bacterium]